VAGEGLYLPVRVTPRASRDEVVGWKNGVLAVRLTASPVDDAANEALIALVSRHFRCPKSAVRIVRGRTGRSKLLFVAGATAKTASERPGG
jgi:hypothetical protein